MAKLAEYGTALLRALDVARALGDAFAWYFYERDQDLIAQHLQHQRQILLPPRVGGLGERVAVENLQGLGGHLLIYHGTTTFLRMGDISYIDLTTVRVASLGEIKTQKIGDGEYRLSVALISDRRDMLPKIKPSPPKAQDGPALGADIRAKLDRQVDGMGKAMERARNHRPDEQASLQSAFHFEVLDDVISRSHARHFEFAAAGPGLVIGALRLRNAGLSHALLGKSSSSEYYAKGFEKAVLQIIDKDLKGNTAHLGGFGLGTDGLVAVAGKLPFALWPLRSNSLVDMLLGNVIVITVYNSAHLYDELSKRGFSIEWTDEGRPRRITRSNSEVKAEFEGMAYFHELISKSLMTQESVLKLIEEFAQAASKPGLRGVHRIVLDPRVHVQAPASSTM